MTNLPFRLLFQLAAFIGVLFLLSAKTPAPETFYSIDTSMAAGDPVYQVIVSPHNSGLGNFSIRVIDTLTKQPPAEDIKFFVLLPDGNFLYIDKESQVGIDPTRFKAEVDLQYYADDPLLFVDNISVFAMKKNDPKPPKRMVPGSEVIYIGMDNVSKSSGDIITPLAGQMANKYLSGDTTAKLGISWFPWDSAGAYYYQIITLTNSDARKGLVSSGTVTLISCYDSTGFEADSFFSYDRKQIPVWPNGDLTNSTVSFPFFNLLNREVRQIYVRMKKTKPATGLTAQYRLIVIYDNLEGPDTTVLTDCQTILLKNAPHDPNAKVVDQSACTANGTGTLTYTTHFQNEGKGVAKNVVIYDTLPPELSPYTIDSTKITSSHKGKLKFFQDSTHPQYIRFEFTNINLPGSSQTAPQVYDYLQTTGWVTFTCSATCPENGKTIENSADIVFIGTDSVAQPPIRTENSKTLADVTPRPGKWNTDCGCRTKDCHPIFRCRRCHWYFCLYKKCSPRIKTLNNSKQ